MDEIEAILATASEPLLPRVKRVCMHKTPQKQKADAPLCLPEPKPETKPEPKTETKDPNMKDCEKNTIPYPLDDGDNPMESILRTTAVIAFLGGICFSIYSAMEVSKLSRCFGGGDTNAFTTFLIGTTISFLAFSVLFVLSNISVNIRTNKHLLAQIARNSEKAKAEDL